MLMIENAQKISARLKKINDAREGVNETEALDKLRKELLQLAAPINIMAANAQIFVDQSGVLTCVPDVSTLADTIKSASERFRETPKSTTLRRGNHWSSLTTKLVTLATKLKDVHESDWKKFFEANYFSGVSPSQREAKLILAIPGNKEAIAAYKVLYQSLTRYRQKMPQSAIEFNELKSISDQLSAISFSEENIPADVRRFFEATGFGASLNLLTNDVFEWLRNNDLLDRYVVRARSN